MLRPFAAAGGRGCSARRAEERIEAVASFVRNGELRN